MPRPLRKSFQRAAADEPRGFSINLSRVAVATLGLALIAVVGWAFFMGFMVGRGQNPEKRVEQMTGMAHEEPTPQAVAGLAAELAAVPSAGVPAGQPTPAEPPPADAAGPERPEISAPPAQTPPAYPFSRPQGAGLAAWGIRPEANTPAPGTDAATRGQRAPAQAARPQTPQQAPRAEALFDFIYQAAAFRDKADADKLRARLEGKGLRTRQQKSGKVLLVLVLLRGTEPDAANLREELQRMKLGKPVLVSKKAVSGKARKAGR
ncbi:SPOR domain-containing protein [Desulfovibrio sp. SGI.169]|uniref:SPOR domain-containing protein n=1 Tax=Desulfovibrio sp. SGI.169 TaxID=3420561 RepID=UPI003D00F557